MDTLDLPTAKDYARLSLLQLLNRLTSVGSGAFKININCDRTQQVQEKDKARHPVGQSSCRRSWLVDRCIGDVRIVDVGMMNHLMVVGLMTANLVPIDCMVTDVTGALRQFSECTNRLMMPDSILK